MHSFTDSRGREWSIELTFGAKLRVQQRCGIDLTGLLVSEKQKDYFAFLDNAELRVRVLYELVKTPELTQEAFFDGLNGDALEAGTMALQEELIDFFPQAKRPTLRQLLETYRKLGEAVLAKGHDKLTSLDLCAEADRLMAELQRRSEMPSASASEPPSSTSSAGVAAASAA